MRRSSQIHDLETLVSALVEQRPQAVCYIAAGGRKLGTMLAERLGLPAVPLEIGYPLSRPLRRLPRAVAAALWPFKELAYKFSSPRPLAGSANLKTGTPIVLVDDSASSGKTLSLALNILAHNNYMPAEVIPVVGRCGRRARGLVDYFLTD